MKRVVEPMPGKGPALVQVDEMQGLACPARKVEHPATTHAVTFGWPWANLPVFLLA